MAEWLGNGLQNHAQQFISFSVINYVVSMRGPHVSGDNLFFYALSSVNSLSAAYTLWTGNPMMV